MTMNAKKSQRRWALALGAALLLGSLTAGEGRAQDTAAVQQADPSALQQQHGVTIQRRGGPPASVQQVRRRIARIGGRRDVARVVFPMVIVITPAPVVYPEAARREQATAAPPPRPSPGAQERYREYYDYYEAPFPPYQEGEERSPIVRFRREGAPADSLRPGLPADSLAPPFPAAAPPAGAPSVHRIERSILETGLFRAVDVNFEFDRSTLLPSARPTLDAVGEVLARYPALRIEVAGHTDAIGPDAYNQRLSEARAQSVRRYLIENFDLAPERITARGYGESQPIASNENATERTLNRRVEFRVLNPEAAEQYLETEEAAGEDDLREVLRQTIREELRRMQVEEDTTRQN